MLDFLSAGIGALGNVLGGLFGQSSAKSVASENIAAQQAFAQHGVTWRAQDATTAQEKTGINRLALLGVPTSSFSNVVGSNDLGSGVAAAGQNISRAIAAATPTVQRQADLEARLTEAKIANINADTIKSTADASAARLAHAPGTPPGAPIPLYVDALDDSGHKLRILNPKVATSFQTPASFPQQGAVALDMLTQPFRHGAADPSFALPSIVLPDVFRDVANKQGSWFGGM